MRNTTERYVQDAIAMALLVDNATGSGVIDVDPSSQFLVLKQGKPTSSLPQAEPPGKTLAAA